MGSIDDLSSVTSVLRRFPEDEPFGLLLSQWRLADLETGSGVFAEAVSESVIANTQELYALALTRPEEFGVKLAAMASEYTLRVAKTLSGVI